MKFNDSNWVVGFIDAEFGIIELHNIYTREKIYCPLPDGDELEAWAMNILALMRRAYDVGKQDERKRSFTTIQGGAAGGQDLRPLAGTAGDNQESDHRDP